MTSNTNRLDGAMMTPRQKFEAHMRANGYTDRQFRINRADKYDSQPMNRAWDVWQAAMLAASPTATSADMQDERGAFNELSNIANAKRFDRETFADDTEFADWAQSRARHTLSRAASTSANVAQGTQSAERELTDELVILATDLLDDLDSRAKDEEPMPGLRFSMAKLRDILSRHNTAMTAAPPAQPANVAPAATAAPEDNRTLNRIARLVDACEGELDGLAVPLEKAQAILEYVDAAAKPIGFVTKEEFQALESGEGAIVSARTRSDDVALYANPPANFADTLIKGSLARLAARDAKHAAPQSSQPVEAGEACEHEWQPMDAPHKECVKCGDVRRDHSAVVLDDEGHEREAFEHWITHEGGYDAVDMQTHKDGLYILGDVAAAWDVWQGARAASPQATATQPVQTERALTDAQVIDIRRAAIEECWEAVHAERLEDPSKNVDDIAYGIAVADCENAVRAILTAAQPASDQKGGQ